MLGKVMERISTDYEELKKAFESQKCPKDDKILALRKTARLGSSYTENSEQSGRGKILSLHDVINSAEQLF